MTYKYIFGATLSADTPTYVQRKADKELFQKLKEGEFCYIFNSRKMGKSSLRLRVMERLKQYNYACSIVDLSADDVNSTTLNNWYFGLIHKITKDLKLNFDLDDWWNKQSLLSPLKKISKFITNILLVQVPNNIIIFIDEIDSVLSLKIPTDDFFAFIRACYNRRVDYPEYNRLTFCLLGVATPSTLIADKRRTPFNIGHALELNDFTLAEAQSLAEGLQDRVAQPEQVLKEIWHWTKGQPFLTQKLLSLVVESAEVNPDIDQLVRSKIIDDWTNQDNPRHLGHIRDRILSNPYLKPRLLGTYQKVLQHGGITADDSDEQLKLRLDGLVVKERNRLKVYNPIYKEIFNENWVENELETVKAVENFRNELSKLAEELSSKDYKFQADSALIIVSLAREFQDNEAEKLMLLSHISFAYLELDKFRKAEEVIKFALEECLNNSEKFQKVEEVIEIARNDLDQNIKSDSVSQKLLQTLVHFYHTQGRLCQKQGYYENALQAYIRAFIILRDTLGKKISLLHRKILPLDIVESIHKNLIKLFDDRQDINFTTNDISLSLIKYLECHYAPIKELLKGKRWRKADEETYRMMIQKVGKEGIQMLMRSDFEKFPLEDLYVVSALWEKYSSGKFGFRKQAEIWLKCGGKKDKRSLAPLIEFWQAVGWVSEGELPEIELNEINYQLPEEIPNGHLPTTGLRFQEVSLFSRFADCDICLLI